MWQVSNGWTVVNCRYNIRANHDELANSLWTILQMSIRLTCGVDVAVAGSAIVGYIQSHRKTLNWIVYVRQEDPG